MSELSAPSALPPGPVGATEACVRQPEEPGGAVLSQPGGNAVKAIRLCKLSVKSVPERGVTVTQSQHACDCRWVHCGCMLPQSRSPYDMHPKCGTNTSRARSVSQWPQRCGANIYLFLFSRHPGAELILKRVFYQTCKLAFPRFMKPTKLFIK